MNVVTYVMDTNYNELMFLLLLFFCFVFVFVFFKFLQVCQFQVDLQRFKFSQSSTHLWYNVILLYPCLTPNQDCVRNSEKVNSLAINNQILIGT